MSQSKTITLGICGGIAAYKACEIVRGFAKQNHNVHVMMSRSAKKFITPLTLQTLSGRPVATDLFDLTQESEIGHIHLADDSDVIVVAPATADFLAKAAHGLADDVISTVLLATKAPVLICPSMNVNMWNHPATQANLKKLQGYGYHILEPDSGELACGWQGQGRLPDPEIIVAKAIEISNS